MPSNDREIQENKRLLKCAIKNCRSAEDLFNSSQKKKRDLSSIILNGASLPYLSINDPIIEVENETLNHEVLNQPQLEVKKTVMVRIFIPVIYVFLDLINQLIFTT